MGAVARTEEAVMKLLAVCVAVLVFGGVVVGAVPLADQVYNMVVGVSMESSPSLECVRGWRALGIPETGIRRLAEDFVLCYWDETPWESEDVIRERAVEAVYLDLCRLVLLRGRADGVLVFGEVVGLLRLALPDVDLARGYWLAQAWWFLVQNGVMPAEEAVVWILKGGGVGTG